MSSFADPSIQQSLNRLKGESSITLDGAQRFVDQLSSPDVSDDSRYEFLGEVLASRKPSHIIHDRAAICLEMARLKAGQNFLASIKNLETKSNFIETLTQHASSLIELCKSGDVTLSDTINASLLVAGFYLSTGLEKPAMDVIFSFSTIICVEADQDQWKKYLEGTSNLILSYFEEVTTRIDGRGNVNLEAEWELLVSAKTRWNDMAGDENAALEDKARAASISIAGCAQAIGDIFLRDRIIRILSKSDKSPEVEFIQQLNKSDRYLRRQLKERPEVELAKLKVPKELNSSSLAIIGISLCNSIIKLIEPDRLPDSPDIVNLRSLQMQLTSLSQVLPGEVPRILRYEIDFHSPEFNAPQKGIYAASAAFLDDRMPPAYRGRMALRLARFEYDQVDENTPVVCKRHLDRAKNYIKLAELYLSHAYYGFSLENKKELAELKLLVKKVGSVVD